VLKTLNQKLREIYWKNYVKMQFSVYGSGLKVLGPVEITGGGKISCGDDFFIRSSRHNAVKIYVASGAKITMGDKVFLNNRVQISCSKEIRIGTHCDIADECFIIDNDFHDVGKEPSKKAPIIIENNVWLASRVIVLKGVTIGEGSVIGAGSVVTKSISPNSFAAGAPAKIIKSNINKLKTN